MFLGSVELAARVERCRGDLDAARAANDSVTIVRNIHALGLCLLAQGKHDEAAQLLGEARIEKDHRLRMLFASVCWNQNLIAPPELDGAAESAAAAIKRLNWHTEDNLCAQCHMRWLAFIAISTIR